MINPLADCTALACALWKRSRERVTITAQRLRSGYRRDTPWRATAWSPGVDSAAYNDPDRTSLDLGADGSDEHAALVALREVLLRCASNAAEACVHAEARWQTLAREERQRAETLRALVTAARAQGAAEGAAEGTLDTAAEAIAQTHQDRDLEPERDPITDDEDA